MPNRPITISASDPKTGHLTLTNNGHNDAKKGDTILWIIGPHSGVTSITAIQKKGGPDIFSTLPHKQGANWTAQVSNTVPDNTQFVYFIGWTDAAGDHHKTDPIITIKPSTGGFSFFILKIATAIMVCLGLSFMLFKKKKIKK